MKALLSLLVATALSPVLFAASPIVPANAPIVITNAGDYFLTRDLIITNPAPVVAIRIAVSNVTLNLNGYIVRYIGPADPVFVLRNGIEAPFNSVVRNGRVRGWSNTGIILAGFEDFQPVGGGGSIDNVGVSECGVGIAAAGGRLRRCLVRDSERDGFVVTASQLTSCVSRDNETGFHGGATNVFTRCTASGNFVGFELEVGNDMERCVSRNNTIFGISVEDGSGCVVRRCTISRNSVIGVSVDQDSSDVLVENNLITRNGAVDNPASHPISVSGVSTTVQFNRLIRNRPNAIFDVGTDTVLLDNKFVPRVP